jgi:predicted PhzF superfamily epimerase YddE/YHI9
MHTSGRTYRLLNVFAEDRLAGNALCVFGDGSGLSDATMQAVALQFNLSETFWAEDAPGRAIARFLFSRSPGTLGEDPGTGSACANLGGWMLATGRTLPVALTIHQGDHLGRACRLHLSVDQERRIFVGGRVIEIGCGQMEL